MNHDAPRGADQVFETIAVPRLAGSAAVARVEDLIIQELDALGFETARMPFTTSARRLHAINIATTACGWIALGVVPLFALAIPGWITTSIGVSALGLAFVVPWGIAEGWLPSNTDRVEARNITGRRSGQVRCWLVAHSDSKAQRKSLAGRVVATLCLFGGALGLSALLAVRLLTPISPLAVMPAVGLMVLGSALLSGPPLEGESAGAVDNASGVLAVLSAAQRLEHRKDVGVLVTGAEEFGMEGARAWAAGETEGEFFVNFDGLDNRGKFNVMTHRSRGGRAQTSKIRHAVQEALGRRGDVRRSSLPLGIFVDGSVLAKAGLSGVTVSRGDWETLSVVHTPRDARQRTDPSAATCAGEAVADAVNALLG